MKNRRFIFSFFIALILFGFSLSITPDVHAADQTFLPDCAVGDGSCDTCDILDFVGNAASVIQQWASGVALFTFVLGGFYFVISAGKPDRVNKGKAVMTGSIIGITLVFVSYVLINFIIAAFLGLDASKIGTDVKLFGKNHWSEYCKERAPKDTGASSTSTVADESDDTEVCSGTPDGQTCTTESCAENCVCLGRSCMPDCQYLGNTQNTGAYCVKDVDGDNNYCIGTESTDESLCPTGQVCCTP
ncbi:MAG: hypothetical protein HYV32_01370 [Candidatus Kerfeldbacteria bacterium]|nr:hypothetical protein [Candidatus Kerfeldbacteria bacterium]